MLDIAFQPREVLGSQLKVQQWQQRAEKRPVAVAKLPGSQLLLVSKVTGIAWA